MLLFSLFSNAQAFITTWQTLNGLTSISFNVTTTGPVTYTWSTVPPAAPSSGSGTFTGPNVTIAGLPPNQDIRLTIQPENFNRFISFDSPFFYQIIDINQWGAVEWTSMENAFKNCAALQVSAIDIPNLTNVTSMANMFENCVNLNSPFNINFWNISNVNNLSGMFKNCVSFNQAVSLWNTTNVSNMSGLFEGARVFNQNIGNWNTANSTTMSKMFKNASEFDRNIGNWNTGNVTDMSEMLEGTAFNKNINTWNTANVTNMSGMFREATFFNQNIGNWNTSNATDMSEMFKDALSFNQNIGNWNTSNVTNMSGMFSSFSFNNIPENYLFNNGGNPSIQNWNTSNVVNMSAMFSRAINFNQNLTNWVLTENVDLTNMLDRSGLDCKNYSMTIIGWNNNPNTPNNRILGATFLEYGPEATAAINNLVLNKGWGFSGHDFISTIPEFDLNATYCQGDLIPALPILSNEGISGTWTPALNSNQTTTYTFITSEGECATSTAVTISINPSTTPLFSPIDPICAGEPLTALPKSSINGIVGSWSPALNNATTSTYTFSPNSGQCAATTTLTIGVNAIDSPTGESSQAVLSGGTLTDITISPANVLWYATLADALANSNPLPLTELLTDGNTYYAVNEDAGCRSAPFAITVFFTLGLDSDNLNQLKFYPNPVVSNLFITNQSQINQIEVYNLLGQLLLSKTFNDAAVEINLEGLPKSIYLVNLQSETGSKLFKIIKE